MKLTNVARGREIARTLIAEMADAAATLERQLGRKSVLGIVAGNDAASRRFVQLKRDALAGVAIEIHAVWLNEDAATDAALDAIRELNARDDVDAIFLQFPLPPGIDAAAASNEVLVRKDIDCSSEPAEREFLAGRSPYTPVAPHAALDLLQSELGTLAGKRIVLFGAEDAFMRALDALLRRAEAVVSQMQSAEEQTTPQAAIDALVIGETLPPAQLFGMLERVHVLLDAGYYLPPRLPDWMPEDAHGRIGVHLTQYGNVGPLTIAHLARATLDAAALAKRPQ